MVWPFSSKKPRHEEPKPEPPSNWLVGLAQDNPELVAKAKVWAPWAIIGLGTAGAIYHRYLRRIPGAAYIKQSYFRKRSIFGRVTRVGDGDNFHLYHTPGGRTFGWGWLRRVPRNKKELKDKTIPIRLAGVDAPEGAHFGKTGQPFAPEALEFLSNYILNRNVRAYVYKRDQYDRVVATVFARRWGIKRNVGLEMVKRGLATVYEAKSGAEFGGLKEVYEKAETKAKAKNLGMWSGQPAEYESPMEYKRKHGAEKSEIEAKDASVSN